MSHSSKARVHLLVLAVCVPLAVVVALLVGQPGIGAQESAHDQQDHDHALRLNQDPDLASRLENTPSTRLGE